MRYLLTRAKTQHPIIPCVHQFDVASCALLAGRTGLTVVVSDAAAIVVFRRKAR